jgi:hypothetical protein
MSKGRKRPSSIEGQFAPRLIEMLQSSPWRTMSLSGRKVVERIEIEFAQHGGEAGGENGRLPVTYDDFVRYGMDRQCVGPAIREAEALGFIVITRRGRAGNAEWHLPTLFRLTFRPAKGIPGNGCSHEWRAIETMEQATILAKAARAAKPEKTKSQWGKIPNFSGGKPTENHLSQYGKPLPKNGHFHSAETPTTFDISGRGAGVAGGKSPALTVTAAWLRAKATKAVH